LLTGLALTAGLVAVATVPAQAAVFKVSIGDHPSAPSTCNGVTSARPRGPRWRSSPSRSPVRTRWPPPWPRTGIATTASTSRSPPPGRRDTPVPSRWSSIRLAPALPRRCWRSARRRARSQAAPRWLLPARAWAAPPRWRWPRRWGRTTPPTAAGRSPNWRRVSRRAATHCSRSRHRRASPARTWSRSTRPAARWPPRW